MINKSLQYLIKVGDKVLPCYTTMGAQRRLKALTGVDLLNGDALTGDAVYAYLYCAVAAACNAEGMPFEYDIETFFDLLDPDEAAKFYTDMAERTKKKVAALQSQASK